FLTKGRARGIGKYANVGSHLERPARLDSLTGGVVRGKNPRHGATERPRKKRYCPYGKNLPGFRPHVNFFPFFHHVGEQTKGRADIPKEESFYIEEYK